MTSGRNDDELLNPAPEHIERRPVTVAARLLLGGPVVLVTASHRGQHNVMPLAWCAPLSGDPPLVGIAVEQSRHTAEMVSHSEEFALNFPSRQLLHHVQYLGALSGSDIDKFEATQLETFAPEHITAPLIEGCVAWVECEVQQVVPIGDHLLFVGLPVSVQVDPQAFDETWTADESAGEVDSRPLHFLGGNRYSALEGVTEARLPSPGEAPERALAERIEEELELSREARERREEQLGELEREVEAGNVIDIAKVALDELPELEDIPRIVVPEREEP
ncbi:MAG: flavin reductase family protein [Dehalococcoidia bacterium]